MKTKKTAEQIAVELGFQPQAKFVTVTESGLVGFTCGKPDEVEELAFRAIKAGYHLTSELAKAAGFSAKRIEAIKAMSDL